MYCFIIKNLLLGNIWFNAFLPYIYFRCYNDGKYIKKLLWILAIYQRVIKKFVAATIFLWPIT